MLFRLLMVMTLLMALAAPAAADFEAGKKAYDAKDWKTAIINLRPDAEAGDDRALVILGNMYADGLGVNKDLTEAFRLYHRAAEKNNPAGMLATATFYQQGYGVEPNTKLSIDWFERSAKLGHQTGAFFYAVALYQGSKGKSFDIKPDLPSAYKWFRIAAKSNNNDEVRKASNLFADKLAEQLKGDEVTTADREAASWKPVSPQELGPIPEAALIKNSAEKPAPAPAPETKDAPAPAAGKTETPAPEKTDAAPEKTDAAPKTETKTP
jgi:TPR repeat protein